METYKKLNKRYSEWFNTMMIKTDGEEDILYGFEDYYIYNKKLDFIFSIQELIDFIDNEYVALFSKHKNLLELSKQYFISKQEDFYNGNNINDNCCNHEASFPPIWEESIDDYIVKLSSRFSIHKRLFVIALIYKNRMIADTMYYPFLNEMKENFKVQFIKYLGADVNFSKQLLEILEIDDIGLIEEAKPELSPNEISLLIYLKLRSLEFSNAHTVNEHFILALKNYDQYGSIKKDTLGSFYKMHSEEIEVFLIELSNNNYNEFNRYGTKTYLTTSGNGSRFGFLYMKIFQSDKMSQLWTSYENHFPKLLNEQIKSEFDNFKSDSKKYLKPQIML